MVTCARLRRTKPFSRRSGGTTDLNDGVRVNIAPLQRADCWRLTCLRSRTWKTAIADRAEWRADERRWCREGSAAAGVVGVLAEVTELTLRDWLRNEVATILERKAPAAAARGVVRHPEGAWRDLLRAAAEDGTFELWAGGEHELVLRERLLTSPPAPRVVWLPIAARRIGYLKVFELQAEHVGGPVSPSSSARRFGVELARDHERGSSAPARIPKECIDRPVSAVSSRRGAANRFSSTRTNPTRARQVRESDREVRGQRTHDVFVRRRDGGLWRCRGRTAG